MESNLFAGAAVSLTTRRTVVLAWTCLAAGHAFAAVCYVDLNNLAPAQPYTTWATAATNIQDAIDVALAGDEIVVTNRVYATGDRVVNGEMTNRVAVCKPVTVCSINCTLSGNSANSGGGGTFGGTLNNCALIGNSAFYGGGACYGTTLNNCTLNGNTASYGGGAYSFDCKPVVTLNNCTITGNTAFDQGGGAWGSQLNSCTLIGNEAFNSGGGASYGCLFNCVSYYNTASIGDNYFYEPRFGYCLDYCCTTPLPPVGEGNFTNEPAFIDLAGGNLRLQTNSPCINSGLNFYAPPGVDLDGFPRISGVTVDVGAYEFQTPASVLSYAWLQQYGLPTDGSADTTDLDGDGMNNWQEWRAGTDPTNALSMLRLLTPMPVGPDLVVRWESVSGRYYFLHRSTNLALPSPFLPLATGIIGQARSTTYTDTNATGQDPYFYRVGVE